MSEPSREGVAATIPEPEREMHRIYAECSPVAILVADPRGRFVDANPAACRMTGFGVEELARMSIPDLLADDDRDRGLEHWRRVRESGRAVGDHRLRRKDGTVVEVTISAVCLSDGRTVGFCLDVTESRRMQRELAETTRMAADIVERIPAGVFVYRHEPDGRLTLLDANSYAERFTGVKLSEWRGRDFDEIWPAARAAGITDAFLAVARGGSGAELEDITYRDDRIHTVSRVHVFPLPADRIAVTFEDITQRKAFEQALKDAEGRYRLIAEHTADVIWMLELPSLRVRYASPSVQRLLGYTPREIVEKTALDVLTPESVEYVTRELRDRLAAFAAGDESQRIRTDDVDQVKKDGTVVPTEIVTTLLPEPDGRVARIVGVSRDIGERKRMGQELERHRLHLEELVAERTEQVREANRILEARSAEVADLYNKAPCGYHSLDATGLIVAMNDTELAWLGYDREEVVGRVSLDQILAPESINTFRTEFPKFQESGFVRDLELDLVRKDGTTLPVLVSATAVRAPDGSFVCSRSTVHDNRERKARDAQVAALNAELERRAHDAEAASRAKSAFLASMSHEIRTPLNAILGFAQLMRRDPSLGSGQRERLDTIRRNGEHLLSLINDVLEMSKIEAGRASANPIVVDLWMLAADLEASFKALAESKRIGFRIDGSRPEPRWVRADGQKLRQILLNLASNAVKFTESGEVVVRLDIRVSAARLRLLAVVADSGPGIAAEDAERIFGPFEQTDLGRRHGGAGLGLAISRQYARLMGGDISVSSEPGKGAEFRLELPVEETSPGSLRRKPGSSSAIDPRACARHRRVLIADDVADNRALLLELLRDSGLEIREARDGGEAVAEFSRWRPDAILMDLRMPVLDGVEAIRRIRASEGGSEPAILVVTASTTEAARREALDAGADEFLGKPFTEAELYHKLWWVLGCGPEAGGRPEPARARPSADRPPVSGDGRIPSGIRERMRDAALCARQDLLVELCAEAAPAAPALASRLGRLAADLDYAAALRLLEGDGT